MREILFRGKCARTGKWAYGFLAGKDVIRTDIGRLKVDPSTVGQFIGKVDSKGIKVFEGDILDAPFAKYGVSSKNSYKRFDVTVKFEDLGFYLNTGLQDLGDHRWFPKVEECTLKGNIHETDKY